MVVQGALWLAKRLSLNLISVLLTEFRYFLYQVATQLSSRGWVDPFLDPILLETFLGYSHKSNPGTLRWQSDDIPNMRITQINSILFFQELPAIKNTGIVYSAAVVVL